MAAHSRPSSLTTDPATSNVSVSSVDESWDEATAKGPPSQPLRKPAAAGTFPDAIAAGERVPDSAPPVPDEQVESEGWPVEAAADDQPAVVMTKGDNGSRRTSINFRALAAAAPSIPMVERVKAMPLSDGQQAAIEQIEAAFQPIIKERLESQAQANRVAMEEVRTAAISEASVCSTRLVSAWGTSPTSRLP